MNTSSTSPASAAARRWVIPIRWKLLAATLIVAVVAAVIAVLSLKRIKTLNDYLSQTVGSLATKSKLASLLRQDLIAATRAERNMILVRSDEAAERLGTLVDQAMVTMQERQGELKIYASQEDRALLARFDGLLSEWRENNQQVRRYADMNSQLQAKQLSTHEGRELVDRIEGLLDAIVNRTTDAPAAEAIRLAAVQTWAAVLRVQRAEKNTVLSIDENVMQIPSDQLAQQRDRVRVQLAALVVALGDEQLVAQEQLATAVEAYLDTNEQIHSVANTRGNMLAYHYVYDVGAPLADEAEILLDRLIGRTEEEMQLQNAEGDQMYESTRRVLLAVSVVGIALSVILSYQMGRGIADRLSVLSRHAQAIRRTGDLSTPTPEVGADEIGQLALAFDQMRNALYEHAANLEDKTRRLAELTRSLDAKNREMEQFVYTVSHDLKSPVVSCKGVIGLLREDVADRDFAAIEDSVDRLEQATDQLSQIIEDLLTLSRIGARALDRQPLDVYALVSDLVEQLDDRIEEAGASVTIASQLPRVVADEACVRRLFENLLTNALKYGCNGENREVAIVGAEQDGETRFCVRDHGPGIDPRYHKKVFGLFQRLDGSIPGTGIGLASVAKIMNLHEGRVWIESAPDEGAEFWVAFPSVAPRGRKV